MARPAEEPMETEGESAPRFRLRGEGKRRRAARKGPSSEHEEADDEASAAWLSDLERRSPTDLRDAFSLKPCSAKELRQLRDDAFLGGKRQAGALPIYDLDGKVSLQFLLASYKVSEKSRERLRGDESIDAHRPFLRWLIKKARELRLLNGREVRRGAVAPQRLARGNETQRWQLSLEQNHAEASDEEARQKQVLQRAQAVEAASVKMEVHFPQKASLSGTSSGGDSTAFKERLRSQLESKKEKMDALSSHGLDLQNMCDRLMAPSLSFDWDEPESDEDENSKGILQVELPAAAATSEGRRALLHKQIQRSVSFKQAKELSKTKSLPSTLSNGSNMSDVREAATPSKKRKVTRSRTEPERSTQLEAVPQDMPSADVSGTPPDQLPQGVKEPEQVEEVPKEVQEVPSSSTEPAPDNSEVRGPVEDTEVSRPSNLEISPTLRFVPQEPEPAEPEPAEPAVGSQRREGGDVDISPTLPFDIDASALQEANAAVDLDAADADALPRASTELEPAPSTEPKWQEDETVEEASSEDEDIKGNTRLMRERAWLRHKRQLQAVQGQEDDDVAAFGAVGRANRRKVAKTSILMGAV